MSRYDKSPALASTVAILVCAMVGCVEPPSAPATSVDIGGALDMRDEGADMVAREDMSMDMSTPPDDMGEADAGDLPAIITNIEITSPDALALERTQVVSLDELSLAVVNSNGEFVTDYQARYQATDPSILLVNEGDGTIEAVDVGETDLTVTIGDVSASIPVTVSAQVLDAIRFERRVMRARRAHDQLGSVTQSVIALSEKGLPIEPFPESECSVTLTNDAVAIVEYIKDIESLAVKAPGVARRTASCRTSSKGLLQDEAIVIVESQQHVSAGEAHTCALSSSREVHCWGRNDSGQIGDGTTRDLLTPGSPRWPDGAPDLFQLVEVGAQHSCAIATEGQLYCWGDNRHGQIDPSSSEDRYLEPHHVSPQQRYVAVSLASAHTCAISEDGELDCWGRDVPGNLSIPVPTRYFALDTSDSHGCAIDFERSARCWGENTFGQLARDDADASDLPAKVSIGEPVHMLSVNNTTSCAANVDDVFCWGKGDLHENGLGSTANGVGMNTSTPTALSLYTAPNSAAVIGGPIYGVSLGPHHGCAIRGGDHYCWGTGQYGQLGQGDYDGSGTTNTLARPVPVLSKEFDAGGDTNASNTTLRITSVGAGAEHSCALDSVDQLFCWGYAGNGRTGNGQSGIRPFDEETPAYASFIKDAAIGREHACVHAAQSTFCYGSNGQAQIGVEQSKGLSLMYLSKPDALTAGASVNNNTPVERLLAGERFTFAFDDTPMMNEWFYATGWGAQNKSQIGNTTYHFTNPKASIPGFVLNSAKLLPPIALGYEHACAMRYNSATDREFICWGDASHGQLGAPEFMGADSTASAHTTEFFDDKEIMHLSGGDDFTCAVVRDAAIELQPAPTTEDLVCWGRSVKRWGMGPLEEGDSAEFKVIATFDVTAPVTHLSVGGDHGCVIHGESLECWGSNSYNQVSAQDVEQVPLPVEVENLESDVALDVAVGHRHTCAIYNVNSRPRVYCWGDNRLGQSGTQTLPLDGNHLVREPALISALDTTWEPAELRVGWATSCALAADVIGGSKKLYCWGLNSHEQARQWRSNAPERQIAVYPEFIQKL